MNDPENLICPFCGDDGFDKIGLKIHLTCWCKEAAMLGMWVMDHGLKRKEKAE